SQQHFTRSSAPRISSVTHHTPHGFGGSGNVVMTEPDEGSSGPPLNHGSRRRLLKGGAGSSEHRHRRLPTEGASGTHFQSMESTPNAILRASVELSAPKGQQMVHSSDVSVSAAGAKIWPPLLHQP